MRWPATLQERTRSETAWNPPAINEWLQLWLSWQLCHPSPVAARDSAQKRADRIRAFREELEAAQADGVVGLSPEQETALRRYHDEVLARLEGAYDVDRSDAQRQLSLGMRIVSLLGAAALTGAVVLFFLEIWSALPSAAQIAIAGTAPLVALSGAVYASRVERTRYFTAILSFLALGCFVMNIAVLGTVLNSTPTSVPLLLCSTFALILAYRWDLGWMLAAGAVGLLAFFATTVVSLGGFPLDVSLQRPEILLAPAAGVFAASTLRTNENRSGFPAILRRVGLSAFLLVLIVLGEARGISFLPFSDTTVNGLYRLVAFATAAAAMWLGMRRGWSETLNLGALAFAVLLLLRYVDWWWEWMPAYLFFLIVAATAIGSLILLRRCRGAMGGAAA
jgi:hypothetical protein